MRGQRAGHQAAGAWQHWDLPDVVQLQLTALWSPGGTAPVKAESLDGCLQQSDLRALVTMAGGQGRWRERHTDTHPRLVTMTKRHETGGRGTGESSPC